MVLGFRRDTSSRAARVRRYSPGVRHPVFTARLPFDVRDRVSCFICAARRVLPDVRRSACAAGRKGVFLTIEFRITLLKQRNSGGERRKTLPRAGFPRIFRIFVRIAGLRYVRGWDARRRRCAKGSAVGGGGIRFPGVFAHRVSRRINGRMSRTALRLCAPHVCLSFLI